MIILVLLFLLSGGLVLLQFDDSPSHEVMAYVTSSEERRSTESPAFLYLNGIGALEGQDVSLEGRRLLNEYNASPPQLDLYPSEDSLTINQLPKPDKTDFFNCHFLDPECFTAILANSEHWQFEINDWSTILDRYEKFITYSEFTINTKPSLNEPVGDYSYFVHGNHIKVLSILSLSNFGRYQEALEELRKDNQYLRKHLVLADSIIQKMIFVHLLENNLNAMAYVNSRQGANNYKNIPLLTASEINMELPFSREFVMGYYSLLELDGAPNFFDTDGEMPYWLVRAIFKPYMTLNSSVGDYSEIIRISQLPAREFFPSLNAAESNNKKVKSIRNYAGSVINEIKMPNFSTYTARMHDLNCKITLLNHAFGKGELENPYGPMYETNKVKDDLICMGGPLEDKNNLRCIKKNYDSFAKQL